MCDVVHQYRGEGRLTDELKCCFFFVFVLLVLIRKSN